MKSAFEYISRDSIQNAAKVLEDIAEAVAIGHLKKHRYRIPNRFKKIQHWFHLQNSAQISPLCCFIISEEIY